MILILTILVSNLSISSSPARKEKEVRTVGAEAAEEAVAEIEMEDGDLTVAVDVPNIRELSVIV